MEFGVQLAAKCGLRTTHTQNMARRHIMIGGDKQLDWDGQPNPSALDATEYTVHNICVCIAKAPVG